MVEQECRRDQPEMGNTRARRRPVTSKSRGICKYYTTPTGCLAGRDCKFLHGEDETLTPYDKAKTCRFFAAGFCKRGAECWFVHSQPADHDAPLPDAYQERSEGNDEDEENLCCICYEKPVTYGLLDGCSHMFCLECIKEWRNPQDKTADVAWSGVIKMCPLCRVASQFITPSSHFYPQEHPSRALIVQKYRESMARVSCSYFQKSSPHSRYCPFGKDCFYKHLNSDGTPYIFNQGVKELIKRRQYRELQGEIRREGPSSASGSMTELDAVIVGLRNLAISVTEAAARTSDADESSALNYEDENWNDENGNPYEPMITRLAETIISSLVGFRTQESPADIRVAGPARISETARSSASHIIEAQATEIGDQGLLLHFSSDAIRSDVIPVGDPPQTTHVDCVVSENTPRPSSTAGVLASRFSTSLQGRLPETLTMNTGRHVNAAVSDVVSSTPTLVSEGQTTISSVESPVDNLQTLPLSRDEIVLSTPSNHCPSYPALTSLEDLSDAKSGQQCLTCDAALMQDTDPPFMTDGRGRVVWSSATAAARARRSTTSTATGTLVAGALQARDKPGGDAHISERYPTDSPSRLITLPVGDGADLEMHP